MKKYIVLLLFALVGPLTAQTTVIGDNGSGCRCASGGTGTVLAGTTVTFSSWAANDDGSQVYRWYHNGTNLNYPTNIFVSLGGSLSQNWYVQYTILNVQPSDEGTYFVVTMRGGQSWTNTFTLYAGTPLRIQGTVVSWSYGLVDAGTTITILQSATGDSDYRWYHNGNRLPYTKSLFWLSDNWYVQLVVTNVQPSTAGVYYCVATENGETWTNSLVIYVRSNLHLETRPSGGDYTYPPLMRLIVGQESSAVAWYTVEYSADLKTWRTLADFITPLTPSGQSFGHLGSWQSDGRGVADFWMPLAGGHCYYRAVANY
jgi:hypothetical protein